jgi:2-polyprenyl-3-methyl-5-hydroxy-6-metoxy-1,4-benzoquinol methylase
VIAPRVLAQIEAAVGKTAVLADPHDLKLYEYDGGVDKSLPEVVVFPRTTEDVVTLVKLARELEIRDTANHQYAYSFDFDVMHPYMIRSFEPFFRPGSLLELGSYKGNFTERFVPYFDDITCVEASSLAIEEARQRLGNEIHFVHSTFETAHLPGRYDNIVLTHVLEHLEDPIGLLRRVNDEWIADAGRLFLVCPNANAPSRQIAVKMGLISHNTAVTPAEREHGHRRTYTLDRLERDAGEAGLKVAHRSGIFFKALANFQWDRLLKTDIVSKEYLDGCYQLGQIYPDLCSSIFLMCERGRRAQGGAA